jgi:hypothetical protein
MVKDRERVDAVYAQVKSAVETQIAYLLAKRETDPYADFRTRILYENRLFAENRKAPSFEL